MSNTRVLLGGLLASMLAGLPAGGADADKSMLPCVQRDLELITLIEENGAAEAVHGPILADAMLAMVDARKSCLEGRVDVALAQYDRIVLHIMQARIPDRPNAGPAGAGLRSAQN